MTWVGAVVSVAGALVAALAAVYARRSAWEVASLNLQIAALEREAEEFREDFRAFLTAQGKVQAFEDVGAVLATGEVLQANPRSSDKLIAAVNDVRRGLQAILSGQTASIRMSGGHASALPDEPFDALREQFRLGITAIAKE